MPKGKSSADEVEMGFDEVPIGTSLSDTGSLPVCLLLEGDTRGLPVGLLPESDTGGLPVGSLPEGGDD